MTHRALYQALRQHGYIGLRQTNEGIWVGVQSMFFTYGLFVGLTTQGYERRYCYATLLAALSACRRYETGDPKGPWTKVKGDGLADRLGPGAGR